MRRKLQGAARVLLSFFQGAPAEMNQLLIGAKPISKYTHLFRGGIPDSESSCAAPSLALDSGGGLQSLKTHTMFKQAKHL